MRQFELDTVGVGEKQGIVARHVTVLGGCVENIGADRLQVFMELIDLLSRWPRDRRP